MPPFPTNSNRRQNQPNRNRSNRIERDGWFDRDDNIDDLSIISAPATNYALSNLFIKERFPELGMTADRMEIENKKIRLSVNPSGETIRLNDRSPGDQKTLDTIAAQDTESSRIGERLTIKGELAPQIASVLIIRDREGSEKVVAFNRPELETFGRKKSGATGLLNGQPGEQSLEEIEQELIIFGRTKIGNEKVIVALDTGENQSTQVMRVFRAKQRLSDLRQRNLQSLFQNKKIDPRAISSATAEVKELMKSHRIVFLKKKNLSPAIAENLQIIETNIGESRAEVKGIVHYSGTEKRPTIIMPVTVDPEADGIKASSLEFLDGSGEQRTVELIDSADGTQADHLRVIVNNLGRPAPVQTEPFGPIILPPTLEAQLDHDPTAVLPFKLD